MPDDKLGIKERAVLLVLMAEARPISNRELTILVGFVLDGKERRNLNRLDLVDSWRDNRPGKPYAHMLTTRGWEWCANELSAPAPIQAGSAGGALYVLLAGIGRFLSGSGLRLTDVFHQ